MKDGAHLSPFSSKAEEGFEYMGVQGSEYWGGGGTKLFAGRKLIGVPAPSRCQVITCLTLKTVV